MRYLCIAILFLSGCDHLRKDSMPAPGAAVSSIDVNKTDAALVFKNGYWYYKGTLLSGTMTDHFTNNGIRSRTSFLNGKEEGWQQIFFENGKISEKRFYHDGEKDSVHCGWWPNGNKRFEYHFKKGVYDGDFKEWYETGEPLKYVHYTNGADDWGKGWRQNGKLYMNFVMKNGRRYGLNNSNLCYTVKKGRGEFVASN